MRKFIMPLLAAGFLAVAGTAATPQTANATSVHVGVNGPGWGFHVGHRDRGYRHYHRDRRFHRAERRWHREHRRWNRRHCRPVFRNVWRWTPYGWENFRVRVGRRCYR